MKKANIFLSYRRDDSEADTRNIRYALQQNGHDVFMDTLVLQGGDRWPDRIENALKNSDIVIVIIGDKWLTTQNVDGRRRIDGEDDWVHLEIKTALRSEKKIIPVLVNGAKIPLQTSLPDDIKEISNRQAISLSRDKWENDLQILIKATDEQSPLYPQKKKPYFLLTSESPRRKELLRQIGWDEGVDYITLGAGVSLRVDESKELTLDDAVKTTELTAREKINWVIENYRSADIAAKYGKGNSSERIIIGVDTVVFCKGKILDRPLLKALLFAGPEDLEHARKRAKKMLLDQKGEKVYIITSLVVASEEDYDNPTVKSVVTEAEMRDYTESDIDNYIFYAEPFDKAGAFGIQEKGVSLFKNIKGSYTNVVGLPLQEFMTLLQEKYGDIFYLPPNKSTLQPDEVIKKTSLSVLCVGDINYDFIYDKLPEDFFVDLHRPGAKIPGSIRRSVGGTGVNFAKGAQKVGFLPCFVVGVIGGDYLSRDVINELHQQAITPIYRPDPSEKTSIAIILRDTANEDTSITLTDAHQSLPDFVVGMASDRIKTSDVFYCSGYCLTDPNRRTSALKMMQIAKEAQRLIVLDVVVGMSNKFSPMDEIKNNSIDVIVSEFPEIFIEFDMTTDGLTELETWDRYKDIIITRLREKFPVTILRTSKYTHEIIITRGNVIGPEPLDYGSLKSRDKVGYGDFRTAKQVYSFLSPRIVLASKSPQRFNLLGQIVAPSKIEVVVSNCSEDKVDDELPFDRVQRLALIKAETVFQEGKYHNDIELIIGADTEIIRKDEKDRWEMVGHPTNSDEANRDLTLLNAKSHLAITGIAVIGKNPKTGEIKKFTDVVKTEVTFANLSPAQIKIYAESGESIGRAGAYAIQGLGAMLIENLEGSYSNVVGLPLERLSEILANEFNKPIWKFDKVSNWSFPDPIKGMQKV